MTGTTGVGNLRGWAVAAGVSVIVGALMVERQAVAALVVPAVLAVMALVLAVRCLVKPDDAGHQRRVLRWTLAAFAAHLIVSLLITNNYSLRSYLGGDAVGYHRGAVGLLSHWAADLPAPRLPSGKHGYYYVLAGVYWIFGPYTSAGLVLNAALAAALVPLISVLTDRLFGRAAARFVPPLVVLAPGLFISTSQLLKEACVLFLLAVAMYCAVRLTERVSLASLICFALVLPLGFTMRAFLVVVFAGGLVTGITLGKNALLGGFSTGLAALFALVLLVFTFGLGYSGYQAATAEDLAHANLVRQDSSTPASGFNTENIDISTPSRALSYLPQGLLSVGLGPFPWELRGGRQMPALADAVVWWALLPSLWRGSRAAFGIAGRRVLVLFLPATITLALLALTISNYGTLLRERTQVFLPLIPIIALGLSMRTTRRSSMPEDATILRSA